LDSATLPEFVDAYFSLFNVIDELIHEGSPFQPESLLLRSFIKHGKFAHRPQFSYTIH